MASSLETLLKILSLEEQKNYENKAVIGGFARFAYHWAREAHSQARSDAHHTIIDKIAEYLRDYDNSVPEERPAIIQAITELIAQTSSDEGESPAGGELDALASSAVSTERSRPRSSIDDRSYEADQGSGNGQPPAEAHVPSRRRPAPQLAVRERRGYHRQRQVSVSRKQLRALDEPVTTIKGVGSQRAEDLAKLGIQTIRDVLAFFPRRYDDYTRMTPINRLQSGQTVTAIGELREPQSYTMKGGGLRVEAFLDDGTAKLRLNWFNQPWMRYQLRDGLHVAVSGKIDQYLGRLVMNNPELEEIDEELLHTGRVVPVYSLTGKLKPRVMRKIVKQVVDEWAPYMPDPLPLDVREQADLMDYGDALAQAHFADSWQDKEDALRRMAFQELFALQLSMLRRRYEWQSRQGPVIQVDGEWLLAATDVLPFALTGAQERAVAQIQEDIASGVPMNRLVQGDVGSGKTIVAALGMAMAIANGYQAALMAPTSILAEQHHKKLVSFFESHPSDYPIQVALLTGNISKSEREAVYAGLASGEIQAVVGTHALIQPAVDYHNLGLAVIDEQHRFGVSQRGALRDKALDGNPHLLVMTATPIPRTLALTMHADLDLTLIDEMPPGRTPVETRVIEKKARERAYAFIRSQIEAGRQAYIVCPLVSDSDGIEAVSAESEYERLSRDVYPDLRLGLLHGQLHNDDKEAVMQAFYAGEIDILISTTVVEVGVDVPNATVMMIENANRFGLAQLHQLRGRVGRGGHSSTCLLVSYRAELDDDPRLSALENSTSGFELAEIDLQQRGAGDLLGVQQSGSFATRFILDYATIPMVETVQETARMVFERDPDLSAPEHETLAELVQQAEPETMGDIS
ncbi:MAG: ATP-dependent DNA helicase RecG [Chloroflexi bacterium]|nr:ATP-dependent DNA helicase RecG [Chloroflexota bacterium]